MNKDIRPLFVPGVVLVSLILAFAFYRLPSTHAQAEKQAPRIVPLPVPVENLSASTAAPNSTTQSFSNTAAITIPSSGNASPYPSNITVSGISAFTRLEVRLNGFSHTYPDDVDILLVGPQGQRTILMSDAGGTNPGVTNLNLTFAQTATTPIPDESGLTTGTFRPANYNPSGVADTFSAPGPGALTDAPADLFVFNGTNPNGTWNLYVVDDASGDSGGISGGWTLTFTVPQIFTVNSPTDTNDGTCDATNCTLREAITAAQDGDLINFSSVFNTPQTINLMAALPDITRSITMQGTGAHLLTVQRAFNAATDFCIFNIPGGVANGVSFSGMTISNGRAGSVAFGGGIYSLSNLTLTNVHVTGNQADAGGGVALSFADGTFNGCTFSGNTATNAGGGGGGIFYLGTGGHTLRLVNSTVSGNNAVSDGGILNLSTGGNSRLEVINTTIANNTAAVNGGIDTFTQGAGTSATTTLRNSIIANNTPNNLATGTAGGGAATFQTLGFNLSDNYNGVFTPLASDITSATPRLAPLALYGGQTPTHALLHGSPALNVGNASGQATDQRGQGRPGNGGTLSPNADIGAFEAQTVTPIIVTNTNDSGAGSLRSAIATLTGVGDPDVYDIQFDSTFFNMPRTITLTSADLFIDGNMTILAPGAGLLTVSGGGNHRVFRVNPGRTASLSGMTITGGNSSGGDGGGIFNGGTLTVTHSTISGNSTSNNGGGIGTGVDSNSRLTVSHSTVSANTAANIGGGISIRRGSVVALNNTTISGNTAGSAGGGIYSDGVAMVNNSTITNNSANNNDPTSVGGFQSDNGGFGIRNSIIAGNIGRDVGGGFTSNGYNLIGNPGSATFNQPGDQSGTSAAPLKPLLGPLANNGGTTATHALLAGSPALDKGNSSRSNSDQRGLTRPVDRAAITNTSDGADIGAFEAQATENLAPSAAATAANVTIPGGTTYSFTVTYTDDVAINVATIATNDVAVTGPNSFNVTPTFVSVNPSGNGTPRTATYSFTPPGGNWNSTDNGTYNITMNANQVTDVANNLPVPAGNIGSFTVNACTYTLSPATPQFVSTSGGNFNLMITTQTGCTWTATENESWLSFTSTTTGTGNGTVSYNVTTNTGAARTGTITVNGQIYTVNQASASNGLQYYPLARPIRLLDTRPGESACHNPAAPLAGGSTRTQQARGTCDGLTIPANATAIVGNATVVNFNSPGGFVTLWPNGQPRPNASNLNYTANQIVPNALTVTLGSDGAFNIFVSGTTHLIVDITGYYAPPSASGLYYHPLPRPIRLLETRAGETGCTVLGAPLVGGSTRTQLAWTTCDGVTIPTAAVAITGNATIVNFQSVGGFVTLWPEAQTRPNASNLNYTANHIVPNAFTVGLSVSGQFNIFLTGTSHFLVDVSGYYSTEANDVNGPGLLFNPLTKPVRLLETRPGEAGCDTPGALLAGGVTRTQNARTTCNGETIPASAQAILGNATVVNLGLPSGFVTLWPEGQTQPTVSNLNYTTNHIVPNAFIVGLGATSGAFNIRALTSIHFIVDVAGYFAP